MTALPGGRTADAWMYDGTPRPCADDPDAWFTRVPKQQAAAIRACDTCPLLDPCRTYGLTVMPSHGIWGGLTTKARLKTQQAQACGTNAAYRRHLARGETCDECQTKQDARVEGRRRARLAEEHVKGGTRTGARIHHRLGEPPCASCSAAVFRERAPERAARSASRKSQRQNAA